MVRLKAFFLIALAVLGFGCAARCRLGSERFEDRPPACQAFLERLDHAVEEAGVRDASAAPVPCFPYLRSNRFLEALKKTFDTDEGRSYWLSWMQELDLTARQKEIQNLPDESVLSLFPESGKKPDREGLFDRAISCSYALLDKDGCRPDFFETLIPLVHVPDEYSSAMRAGGLYPLAWLPITIATNLAREEFKAWYAKDEQTLPVAGELTVFAPPAVLPLQQSQLEDIIQGSLANPLDVPRPDEFQTAMLVAAFAPVFVQDVAAPHDRFGTVLWEGDGLRIDELRPSVYYYLTHAFLHGEPIVQINYVVWYAARAGEKTPWMERGHLDGMTVRISLDRRAVPFMVDVMNNCGCYHLFSPLQTTVERVISKRFGPDPFVPQWLPLISPRLRLGIRVNSGWHQVERLFAAAPENATAYELVPYDVLETLPKKDGKTASIFDAKGIVKGSKRIEPYILFPAGIPAVGSMRQRGNHPISLTGRNHFDDPHLFEKNFVFKDHEALDSDVGIAESNRFFQNQVHHGATENTEE